MTGPERRRRRVLSRTRIHDRVRELGLAPEILRVTEQGGMAALVELLDASAIEYVRVS